MALLRPLLALLASAVLSFGQEKASLTVEQVVAKARAAVAKSPKALAAIKSFRLDCLTSDKAGLPSFRTSLLLAQPGLRLMRNLNPNSAAELVVCAGRLDGWSTSKADALASPKISIVPFEEYRRLKEMAIDDLAFFDLPAPSVGQASYRGPAAIAGRPTETVEYAYKNGFSITRHFDAQSFALVASDQKMPNGKIQRQIVEGFTWVQDVAFPAKERITLNDEPVGEVTYVSVTINPDLSSDPFAFPNF